MQQPIPISELERLIRSLLQCRERRRRLITVLTTLSAALAAFLVLAVIEYYAFVPPVYRFLMWVVVPAAAFPVWYFVVKRFPATSFDQAYPDLSEALGKPEIRYVLDLSLKGNPDRAGLHHAAIRQDLEKLDTAELKQLGRRYDREHPYRTGAWMSGFTALNLSGLLLIFILFDASPFLRLAQPFTVFERPNPFQFTLEPGDLTMEQGQTLSVSVRFSDAIPEEVQFALKTDTEADYRFFRMTGTDSVFTFNTDPLFDSVTYYVSMNGYRSSVFRVNVSVLPRFTDLTVRVEPPPYTRLEPAVYRYPFSRVDAYPGSEISLTGSFNNPMIYTLLQGKNGVLASSADTLSRFDHRFTVVHPDSLSFEMTDINGLRNRNPFSFVLHLLEDREPQARWIRPEAVISMLDPQPLGLVYELSDDFGFSRVHLHYRHRKAFRDRPVTGRIPLRTPDTRITVTEYIWDLSTLSPASLDEIAYWIEVSDNDAVGGYKMVKSAEQIIQFQSLAEYLLNQEVREEDIRDGLTTVEETIRENLEELERFREQLRQDQSGSTEQQQTLEQIRDEQERISEQIKDIQDQFESLNQEIQETAGLSEETRRLYNELDALMKEIDDPDFRKALEALQKALENMDQQQLRKALEDLDFNEERFRERLERTMELFKSIRTNADLDRTAAMLEELEGIEQSLQDMEEGSEADQAAQQQQVNEQLESIQERLDNLPRNASKRQMEQVEQLRDALQEPLQETRDGVQENIEELQQPEPDRERSRQQQEQIQQQMQQMRRQITETREQMSGQQMQINMASLMNIMQHLLLLSEAQEELVKTTAAFSPGSASFIEAARMQRLLGVQFGFVSDSLSAVSKEIPGFSNRINTRKLEVQRHLDSAVGWLAERDRGRAAGEERFALGGMNEIASTLADLIDQLQNQDQSGGGGGGMSTQQMMEQMQQMMQNQQQLNQQLQDMINDMQGERLMQNQMDRLNQMARQQNEIRKQLRNLQQGGGLEPGDKLLSELERLAEEMEDAINDFRGGSIDRIAVQRQQNILSRMLEAERSINERDEDEKREGEAAGTPDRESPPPLTIEELREEIRRTLQDPNYTRYSDEYQRLIQKYFELLQELERRGGI